MGFSFLSLVSSDCFFNASFYYIFFLLIKKKKKKRNLACWCFPISLSLSFVCCSILFVIVLRMIYGYFLMMKDYIWHHQV